MCEVSRVGGKNAVSPQRVEFSSEFCPKVPCSQMSPKFCSLGRGWEGRKERVSQQAPHPLQVPGPREENMLSKGKANGNVKCMHGHVKEEQPQASTAWEDNNARKGTGKCVKRARKMHLQSKYKKRCPTLNLVPVFFSC